MDKRTLAIEKAAYYWELGLLRFLFEKGILTEKEYSEIRKIADEQACAKSVVS